MDYKVINAVGYYKQYLFDKNRDKFMNNMKKLNDVNINYFMESSEYKEIDIISNIIIINLVNFLEKNRHEEVDFELNCYKAKIYTLDEKIKYIDIVNKFLGLIKKYNIKYEINILYEMKYYKEIYTGDNMEEIKDKIELMTENSDFMCHKYKTININDYKEEIKNKIKLWSEYNDINFENYPEYIKL